MSDGAGDQRLDKWLFVARLVRTRQGAAELCTARRVRLTRPGFDARIIDKPHAPVRIGDVVTLPHGDRIRVVEVLGLEDRRGGATTAQTLYRDL